MSGDLIPGRTIDGTTAPFGPVIANTLSKYRRLGATPAISPKVILQAPLWYDPQVASRHTTRARSWRSWRDGREETWRVETANVLNEVAEGIPASGLLRYLDLDVTMALSLHRTRSGSRDLEIEQSGLLRAMGFDDPSMVSYAAIRGSLRRMLNTKIAILREGQRYDDSDSWQIIDEAEIQADHQLCRPSRLHLRLNRIWDDAIVSDDWQAVDLNGYLLLARKLRREGLARVIYLYLSSWRDRNGSFDVPAIAIMERFAQRRADRRFRFLHPFQDPRSSLCRALRWLTQLGVVNFVEDLDQVPLLEARIRGRFQSVPDQIDDGPRQLVLFKPSVWDPAVIRMVADTPRAIPEIEDPAEQPPNPSLEDWDAIQDSYCERTIPVLLDHFEPTLARRKLSLSRTAGWTVRQLWIAIGQVLWLHLVGKSVANPAAYVARILANGTDDGSYREAFNRETLLAGAGITYHQWLRWVSTGPLRQFPPPRRAAVPSESA